MLPLPLAASLAVLQLALAVGWQAYAVCLPPLIAAVGLPASATPWILFVDQLMFAALDLSLALAMGPVLRLRERAMPLLIPAMVVSVGAMLLLPSAAGVGPVALLAALLIWVACSACLRAPVLLLFARHVPPARHPAGLPLALVGSGLAAAFAPFAQARFKAGSPFSAFALASVLLVGASLALLLAERRVTPRPAPPRPAPWTAGEGIRLGLVGGGVLVLATGAQIHLLLRANPLLAAVVAPEEVRWVLALGGALAAVSAAMGGLLCARVPPPVLVATGAGGLCLGIGVAALAGGPIFVAAGVVLAMGAASLAGACAMQSAALAGDPGRQGLFLGVWSSMGAVAAMVRLGLVSTGVAARVPGAALDLSSAVFPAMAAVAFLALLLAGRRRWGAMANKQAPR